MNNANELDPRVVGERLLHARRRCGLTQEDVATRLEVSRPTLIAIEQGTRPAKPHELTRLATLYGMQLFELLRTGAPSVELQPQFRAVISSGAKDSEPLREAINELERRAEDYRSLENLMNAPLPERFPEPESIPAQQRAVISMAEDLANRERLRLALGDQPVLNLRELLESEMGLRIFHMKLPSEISGLYGYTRNTGPCILANMDHPPERRRFTYAHEFGHFLTDRYSPGVDYVDSVNRKPASEVFADCFAASFLMPSSSTRRHFSQVLNASADFQVADLCRMSNFFFVSVEAMTHRLEDLDLLPKSSYKRLVASGFQIRSARQELGLTPAVPESDTEFPERYVMLAVLAYQEEKISEGQLARYLRTDRVKAREQVQRWARSSRVESGGEEVQLRIDFSLIGKKS